MFFLQQRSPCPPVYRSYLFPSCNGFQVTFPNSVSCIISMLHFCLFLGSFKKIIGSFFSSAFAQSGVDGQDIRTAEGSPFHIRDAVGDAIDSFSYDALNASVPVFNLVFDFLTFFCCSSEWGCSPQAVFYVCTIESPANPVVKDFANVIPLLYLL